LRPYTGSMPLADNDVPKGPIDTPDLDDPPNLRTWT
jgi:hypothetical protein